MLVGSGALAAGLLTYWQRSGKKAAAPVEVAAEQIRPTPKTAAQAAAPSPTQTSDKTAPAEPADDKSKPLEETVTAPRKDGDVAGAAAAAAAPTSSASAGEPVGIVADQQKGMVDEGPTGLLADAPAKTEPLGVPEEPKLAVVADTPKGLYEERTRAKTPEWLAPRGGTIDSQKAVEDGLNWLARHQGADGHWGADCLSTAPNSRCDPNGPCQGPGGAYEAAHTGLALLAFQAAGHYYFNGQKYSGQVAKGLDCLVQGQSPDGSIVGSQNPSPEEINAGAKFHRYFMYEHAMATFAMCEACAVAIAEGKKPDPRYQTAAARAVSFIEKVQHRDGGWRYQADPKERSDCSVSGWVMLALKTAREAKVEVSLQTVARMMHFFAAHYADGQTYYILGPDPKPLIWQGADMGTQATTGVGMMAVEFFQHKLDSPIVQWGAAYLADQADALAPRPAAAGFGGVPFPEVKGMAFMVPGNNYYIWYNCTMAMFQVGGEPWKRWNGVLRDRVIALQVQGQECDRGSWVPDDPYSLHGGRIYSTALAVLTLEVYYRFQRVAGQPEEEKFFEK
jgi:hypothetical protein